MPTTRAAELDLNGADDGSSINPWGWAQIWHFALSFDVAIYNDSSGDHIDGDLVLERLRDASLSGTLPSFGLSELRAALVALYWGCGAGAIGSPADAQLIDLLLDAIYEHVAPSHARPHGSIGPVEPGLGVFGKAIADGQYRYQFKARDRAWTRIEIFDRVAGLLLRELDPSVAVHALYLYPPAYEAEDPRSSPTHTAMVLLSQAENGSARADLAAEYVRLGRLVVRELGDPRSAMWPDTTASAT